MDDSGSNNTLEGSSDQIIANNIKKPKKRSLVERELETNLTDRVISPVSNGDSLSRYGRARRSITNNESLNKELISLTTKTLSTEKSPNNEIATKLPLKSPESDRNVNKAAEDIIGMNKDNCIQSISTENLSLISFGSEVSTTSSPMKKSGKVYVRKDLMQQKDGKIGKIMKNIFSPIKSPSKKSNSHLNNVLERSEKYELDSNEKRKVSNGYIDTSSVVKNLDFDTGKGKKKDVIPEQNEFLSKSDLFDQESKCVYQVGDMAWARVGSYPFWPCFVTRDPFSGIFVKKKLFGRIERDVIHVTFLGDNGRRGWIVENMLRKYSGIEEFENTKKELNHEFKKKDPRLYAAFFVSEKQMPKWKISVDEAEILLNEPKRLRLNIFNDMLVISRSEKSGTPCRPKSSKICRTDSDVSLSESLYDSLFSEDDCKNDDLESRNRSKNRSLDVSEVVTACLDNMAAKTGMAKIQKQSHMDIWLQKAKSQTPEKNKTVVTKKNKVSKIHKKKSNINKLTPSKDISKKSERSSPRKHSNSKLTDEIKEHSCSKSADCSGAKISKIKTENSKTEPHDTVEIMDDKKKTSFFDYKESSDISNDYGRDNTKKELTDANFKTRSAKDKSLTSSFNTSDMNIEIKPDDFNTKYDKMIDTVSLQRKDPGILNTSSQDTDISMVPIKTLADIENKKKFNTKQKKLNTLSKLLKPRDVQHSIPREKLLNEHQANLIVKPKVTKKQSKKLCKKVNTFDYLNSVPGTSSSSKPFIPYVNESSEKNQQNISKQDIPLIEDDQSEVSIIQKVSEKEMFVSSDDTLQSFNISFEESETCIVSDKEKARSKNQTKFNSKEFKGKTERTRKNEKISMSLRSDPIKEVAFLNFLELRKDLFMDQYPELSENEIAEYIYKVWLYENESPNDVIIEDEKCDVISGLITQDVDHNTHISEPNTKKDTIKSTIKDYFTPESSSSSVSLAKNEVSDIDSNLQPCDISKNKTVSISYNSNQMPSNVCIDANAGIKDSVKENQPSFDSLATDDTALNDTDSGSEILNVVTNKLNNIVNEHGLKVNDDNLARNESVLVPNKLVNGKDVRPESSRKEVIVNNTNAGKNVAVIDNEKKMTDQTIMVKLSNGGIHNSDENDMEDVNVCQMKSSTKAYSATSPLRVAKMDEIINDEMVNHNNVSLSGTKSCALEDKTNDIIELCGKSDNHIEASKNKMTKMTNCELVSNRLANGDVTRDTLDKSCNDFKYPSTNEKKSAKVSNLLNENGDCISVTKKKESGPEECVNGEIVTHNNVKRLANSFKTDIVAVEYERSKKSPLRKLRLNRQRNRVETHNDHSNHYDIKHPEFVEYIELKRDALLDENPNFTQDMITSYLYKTWLYEKEIKSRENGKTKLDYNDRKEVYELTEIIKCKESVDSLMVSDDFESNIDSISNTADEEICSKKSISCCNGVREIFSTRIPKVVLKNIDLSKKLQEISAVKENFELTDFDKFHSSSKALLEEDIKNTKSDLVMKEVKVKLQDFVLNQRQNSCETTDPLDKFRAFQQGAISESIKFDSDNFLEGSELHPSLNNPSAKEMKNPKFLEYAELKRDYVLDENPELTDDLVLAYLYKTWLYEQGEKTNEIKDDFDHANEVQGIDEEITHVNSDEETNAKNINSEINMSTNISDHESQGASEQSQTVDDEEDSSDNDVLDSIRTETPTNETSKVNSSDSTNADEDADLSIVKDEPVHLKENDKNKDSPSSCRDESENQTTTNKDFMTELDRSDNSEISNKSEQIITRKSKNKQKQAKSKDFDNLYDHPEFTKYIERRQGPLMDENPNISPDDVISYLYKSWLYEQSDKPDKLISDEVDNLEIIKDFDKKPSLTPKKIRKRDKVKKEKCVYEDDQFDAQDLIPKEKPKRKTVKPYYNEEEDFENEIAIFEIFKKKPKKPTESMKSTAMIKEELKVEPKEAEPPEQVINNNGAVEIVDAIECEDKVYDMEEYYFSQLTDPKPNIFKGLTREKVCEICEKPSCLVKCKGPCCGMFHIDCVKRESKPFIAPTPSRGRKKKNQRGPKPRGRDNSNSFNGSYSDEKSQGNISDDNLNISIDEKSDIEPYMIIDLDEFETQMEAKMKEMLLKAEENVIFDLTGCDDETAWKNTVPGQCEIVDVKLNLKEAEEMPGFDNFKCNHCQKHGRPLCFICKSTKSPKKLLDHRQRCQFAHCHKFYHLECLESWPQTQFNSGEPTKKIGEHFEALTCPRHVCHTCVSDDPRGCKTRFSGDKLARCVRCPATYHSFTKCLPAGSQILSASHIICPRHTDPKPGKVPCHVNTGWCFICALGGTLICCEYCPTSFHAECLNIKPPEGNYMCEDCETGRLPLYGEMVWVKLGHYRWWPGLILHPSEIPNNLRLMKHSMGEFVVRFFGQYDHYWVNRGRVFPFQEGDSGRVSNQKSKIDEAFSKAMEHAQRACEILKTASPGTSEDPDIASSLLPPHYVKLKVNKPRGQLAGRRADDEANSFAQCECDAGAPDPCGPASQCLNRMLLTECGPQCHTGERCNNRAFEKRQYPKLTAYRTPHRGWGLKTLEDIQQGQFVIEYVGELIDEEEFRRRMRRMHEVRDENFYFLTLDKDRMIDAGPKGNLARFMNHCCEPNCETQKWTVLGDVRVGLFALRDIPANSEVTFNYNLECAGIEKKRCLCGAKRCSGYIGAKPKEEPKIKKSVGRPSSAKRPYKKKKPAELSPTTVKPKNKPRTSKTSSKPKELSEIEKDLLIIKNATNLISSDSECSGRLSSLDSQENLKEMQKSLKRKLDMSEESKDIDSDSPLAKKVKSNIGNSDVS